MEPQTAIAPRNVDQRGAHLYTGIAERTLEALRLRGGGPAYFKVGRRVLYSIEQLDRWMATKVRTSTSDRGEAVQL